MAYDFDFWLVIGRDVGDRRRHDVIVCRLLGRAQNHLLQMNTSHAGFGKHERYNTWMTHATYKAHAMQSSGLVQNSYMNRVYTMIHRI